WTVPSSEKALLRADSRDSSQRLSFEGISSRCSPSPTQSKLKNRLLEAAPGCFFRKAEAPKRLRSLLSRNTRHTRLLWGRALAMASRARTPEVLPLALLRLAGP